MATLDIIRRTSGRTRSNLLLQECRRVKLNHSQGYIFDESNHEYILHELELRGQKSGPSKSQPIKVELLDAYEKVYKSFRLIIQNKQRAVSEILTNSAGDRAYIDTRLTAYYHNSIDNLRRIESSKSVKNDNYLNAV